ncbi:MAG: chemotaxis response regulator protein-glutamate methylesterase [Gammaproteobacteria bacterium]|nr:chemotaxis response regulator protein-glutamate methylesterase [Gammaproteobacteria bacterium]
MAVGVLVVDDSNFFRQRICKIIDAFDGMEVIGIASNGKEAIVKNAALKPDIITMDYEMPGMDGVTAIRQVMADRPVPVLMLSSLSYDGARVTLNALDAGAADYLLKDYDSFAKAANSTQSELYQKLKGLSTKSTAEFYRDHFKSDNADMSTAPVQQSVAVNSPLVKSSLIKKQVSPAVKNNREVNAEQRCFNPFEVLLIGCSTGGPALLNRIMSEVSVKFPLPIVIALHMPEYFTSIFAKRLNQLSSLQVKLAESGDMLKSGHVYLAPGGKQLIFDKQSPKKLMVIPNSKELNYSPCVDVLFASAARVMGKKTLGLVLTGMGNDGKEGARVLKNVGGGVWIQDQKTCVVYGMPGSIAAANLADEELSAEQIIQKFKAGR